MTLLEKPEIAIVIPLLNEEGSLAELHQKITDSMVGVQRNYETDVRPREPALNYPVFVQHR
jgi:hypothetical protein